MRTWTSLLIAAPVALGLLAAPAAHADWRHNGGWDNGWHGHEHHGNGDAVAGALLGLGYSMREADEAVQAVANDADSQQETDVAALLRVALRSLGRA